MCPKERAGEGQWEPVLQDLQIAFYDLEPDWEPEHFEEIQRRLSADADDGEKS